MASLYLGRSVSAILSGGWEQSTERGQEGKRCHSPLGLQTEGPGNTGSRGLSLVTFGTSGEEAWVLGPTRTNIF